jgi:hypothetical protein
MSFRSRLLALAGLLLLAAPPAKAQISPRLIAPTSGTATLAEPGRMTTAARRAYEGYAERFLPPVIAAVPAQIAWGDEITVTGSGFTSPTVQLVAPVIGAVAGTYFHYPLTPYQVTSNSFKLLIHRDKVGSASPTMRLVVASAYGADTSDTEVMLNRSPRIDTMIVGGAWRQAGTPQMWWQRVIWLAGRNLDGATTASVGTSYVPPTDIWFNNADMSAIQINVPRPCSGQGKVTITFEPTRSPTAAAMTAPGEVTCLPNDQISSP